MTRSRTIVMIATSMQTMGGVASVLRVYNEAGLLQRHGVRLLETHRDGSAATKLAVHLRALVTFYALLLHGRVGLLHVHVSCHASFWRKYTFMVPAMVLRVPVLLHLHGAEFDTFYRNDLGPARRRVVRWVFDRAAVVVVLSESWRTWVGTISANPRVEVVHNPIILPEEVPPPMQRESGVVLTLGRLGRRKGSYDLVEAAARLAATHRRIRLRMAGDGELEQVAERASQLGVDVELLGWIDPEERAAELMGARVFALPSYAEGLPMALLEAMAAGLPVVATPIGGITDAVTDGVEGFLVPPGDVDLLAARIGDLLDDPALAARLGLAARARAADFSAQAVVPRIDAIYQRLGFGRYLPERDAVTTEAAGPDSVGLVERPSPTLRDKVRRVAAASVVGLGLAQIISLAQTVVLARLLSPFEVGVFAAGTVLMAFMANLAEGGLRTALIQKHGDVDRAAETVFWATLASGTLMCLLALAGSPIVARVFDSSEAGAIAAATAPTMVLFALATVPDGLLQRQFNVRRRLVVGPSVSGAFAITAVAAALLGFGAWSLVIGTYAQCVALLFTTWWVCGWRPGRIRPSFRLWREMARYGSPLSIELFLLRLKESLWRVIIDRSLGTASLGQFRYGERLARIPFSAVIEVGSYALLPAFSRVARESERLRAVFMDVLRWATFGGAAAAGLLLALGESAVVVLLGETWRGAGVIAASMAGMALGAAWSAAGGEAAAGAGRTLRVLTTTVIGFVLGLGLLLGMVGPLGVVGVGMSISLTALMGGMVMLILSRAVVDVRGREMTVIILPGVISALVAAGVTFALDRLVLHADRHGFLIGLALLSLEVLVFIAIHLGVGGVLDGQLRQGITSGSGSVTRRLHHRHQDPRSIR